MASAIGRLLRRLARARAAPRLGLALALGAGLLAARPAVGAEGPRIEQTTLPNGLLVVTERRAESEVAAVVVAVRAGSRFEDEQSASAAHMLEHMYFQGTPSRQSFDALQRPIAALGGPLATWAEWELVRIETSVRAVDLDTAIDVTSDMLQHSLFDLDKYDKERRVVLQELADIEDDPAALALYTLRTELFAGQGLGHLETGSTAGVRGLTLDDLLAYRDRYVGSNRTVVAVVSPFEHADIVARIDRAYADFRPLEAPSAAPADLGATRTGRIDLSGGSAQAQVAVGAPIPGRTSPDRYPLAVARAVLSGFTGRLTTEIREKLGLAYHPSAQAATTSDGGIFALAAGTEPQNAERVIELLQLELARLRDEPLDQAELARAVGFVRGGRLLDAETAAARALDLAHTWALGGGESIEEVDARLAAVTAADVQRVARAYLGPERQLVVVVTP